MLAGYRFDPAHSRFTVQVFATGLLSFAGHDPVFAVRDFSGELWFDPDSPNGFRVELAVRADSLELAGNASPSDRAEIETRMRRDVLDVTTYPEIRFRGTEVTGSRLDEKQFGLRVTGTLSLHGVANPHRVDARLTVFGDGVRLAGESAVRQSAHAIRPVTALGGTIRLKDDVRVSFDLAVLRLPGGQP